MTIDFVDYWWIYLFGSIVCALISSNCAGRATDQLVPRTQRRASLSAFFLFSYLAVDLAKNMLA